MYRFKDKKSVVIVLVSAVLLGIIVGSIAAIFGLILIKITNFRYEHYSYLLPFLSISGLLIVLIYRKIGRNSSKGMTLVFEKAHGADEKIPAIMIPLVIITTWITHLFGGSAGREGVSVQIGATVGYKIGEFFKSEEISHVLLIAGMAAGFAGLFRTPIAAIFFAMELLVVGRMSYYALIPATIAAFTAYKTSEFIGLEKFTFIIHTDGQLIYSPEFIIKIVIMAILFGLTGRLFAALLKYLKKYFGEKLDNPYKKIFVIGVLVSIVILFFHQGRYAGLGLRLISDSLNGGTIYSYDFLIKLLLTTVTLAAGFQGGEVTPLFAIGASLGAFLALVLGFNVPLSAALGYVAVFSSATNTLLAPIFIGGEVFGYEHMPLFVFVTIIAYSVNGNRTIYARQDILRVNYKKK